jgi:hypothetical protein
LDAIEKWVVDMQFAHQMDVRRRIDQWHGMRRIFPLCLRLVTTKSKPKMRSIAMDLDRCNLAVLMLCPISSSVRPDTQIRLVFMWPADWPRQRRITINMSALIRALICCKRKRKALTCLLCDQVVLNECTWPFGNVFLRVPQEEAGENG